MVLSKLDSHVQSTTLDHNLESYSKINSKCIKHWNVRPGAIQFLQRNAGSKLSDMGLGGAFLDLIPNQTQQKQKQTMEPHPIQAFSQAGTCFWNPGHLLPFQICSSLRKQRPWWFAQRPGCGTQFIWPEIMQRLTSNARDPARVILKLPR